MPKPRPPTAVVVPVALVAVVTVAVVAAVVVVATVGVRVRVVMGDVRLVGVGLLAHGGAPFS